MDGGRCGGEGVVGDGCAIATQAVKEGRLTRVGEPQEVSRQVAPFEYYEWIVRALLRGGLLPLYGLQLLQAAQELPADLNVLAAYVGRPVPQEAVDDADLLGCGLSLERRSDLTSHIFGFKRHG